MSKIDIATNYAKALYDVSKENSSSEKVLHQLFELRSAMETVNEKVSFTEEDAVSFVEKFAFEPELKEVLKLMAVNERFMVLPMLHEEFQTFLDKDMDVIRGNVTSADALSNEQKTVIETFVHETTKMKAILTYREDPSILGGFIVDVGTMKMDGSLQNQLSNMKNYINNGVH